MHKKSKDFLEKYGEILCKEEKLKNTYLLVRIPRD